MAQYIDTPYKGQMTTSGLNKRFNDSLGGSKVVSGFYVSAGSSGMTFNVSPGVLYINGVRIEETTSFTVNGTNGDASYGRYDILYCRYVHADGNTSATWGILTGTASATPVLGYVPDSTYLPVAYIYVPAGATAASSCTIGYIGRPKFQTTFNYVNKSIEISYIG